MKKDGNWVENRRKIFPSRRSSVFQQFSVALISVKKNPRPYGRGLDIAI